MTSIVHTPSLVQRNPQLQSELWEKIVGFLDNPQDIVSVARVSKMHKEVTKQILLHKQQLADNDFLYNYSTRKLSSWLAYVKAKASSDDIDTVIRKFRAKMKDFTDRMEAEVKEIEDYMGGQEEYYDSLETIARYKIQIALCQYCMYRLQMQRAEMSPRMKSPPNSKMLKEALENAFRAVRASTYYKNIFTTFNMRLILYMFKRASLETPEDIRAYARENSVSRSSTTKSD